MPKNLLAYIELTSATVIAGSSVVVSKIITNSLPIYLTQWLCLLAALLALLPICRISEGKFPCVRFKDLPFISLQSLFGMFLFRVFLLHGLKYTSAIDSGIITSSTPAIVCILAFLFLKESLSIKKVAGILCTVAGISVINLVGISPSVDGHKSSLLGILLVLSAVVCEALLTIFRKLASANVSPMTGTFYVTLFTFAFFTPNALFELRSFSITSMSPGHWMIVLYYGVVITAIAYIFWFSGVAKVAASTAAAYTGVIPVSTLLLSSWFLKERVTLLHIAGITLVVSGIVFISVFDNLQKKRDTSVVARSATYTCSKENL